MSSFLWRSSYTLLHGAAARFAVGRVLRWIFPPTVEGIAMQMHDVQQLKEAYSLQDANKLLAQGWTLIAVVATTNPKNLNVKTPCYIFGLKNPAA